jgi:hypothetical protein
MLHKLVVALTDYRFTGMASQHQLQILDPEIGQQWGATCEYILFIFDAILTFVVTHQTVLSGPR